MATKRARSPFRKVSQVLPKNRKPGKFTYDTITDLRTGRTNVVRIGQRPKVAKKIRQF